MRKHLRVKVVFGREKPVLSKIGPQMEVFRILRV